jgi:hypothetical protein
MRRSAHLAMIEWPMSHLATVTLFIRPPINDLLTAVH